MLLKRFMILNNIKIENFLSISKAEIDFEDYQGITLITGENKDANPPISNGSGKSSIIEALIFGLFGKTIRKTVDKTVSNQYSKKGCSITLRVNDNILIERSKKPSRLRVYVGGKDISKENASKTQFELDKMLNTSYKSTLASLIFGQHNTVNFIAANPEEKRTLIQKYLGIEKIFKLREGTLKLKGEASSLMKETEVQANVYQKEIDFIENKLKECKKNIHQGKQLLDKPEIIDLLETKTLDEIFDIEQNKESLTTEVTALSQKRHDLSTFLNQNKKTIKFLGVSECENCKWINPSNESKLKELKTENNKITQKMSQFATKIKSMTKKFDSVNIVLSNQDIETLKGLTHFITEETSLLSSKERYEKMFDSSMEEAEGHKRTYEVYKFWEKAFSEKGLIKYIIRNILDFLNQRCNYYLAFLSQGMFHVNLLEDLNVKIFQSSTEKDYNVMSGGEKRRLDLAITLTLNDLASLVNNTQTDVVFFDEAVENLDKEGIKGFISLLYDIAKTKKIFIITHNPYFLSLLDGVPEVVVTKKDGFSTIKGV